MKKFFSNTWIPNPFVIPGLTRNQSSASLDPGSTAGMTQRKWIPAFAGMTIALLFSFFLMFHTFSYDQGRHELQIASKLWSDFGAHIPLVRSFSQGPNLSRLLHARPVESPLFPGEPIRYHFGFYAVVGMLEKAGLPLDWALNVPSALGFFLLIFFIFWLSYTLFSDYSLSLLSVVFFLFNGSASFLRFFAEHPLHFTTPADIIANSRFPSFGPWDGGMITAFWNLNIYTNQRHLAFSYALILWVMLLFMTATRRRTSVIAALVLSILAFFHFAALAIAGLFLLWTFLTKKAARGPLFLTGFLLVPALILLARTTNVSSGITFAPGYLVREPVTIAAFITFWFANLGLHAVFIPLGLLLAPKEIRRSFGPPFLLLFVLPNLFRFSPDMINNHKFFNFFLIVGNMFSAYAVLFVLKQCRKITRQQLRKPLQIIVGIGVIGALTLSGIIDFFPIINDDKGNIADGETNPDVAYFLTVPADAVVANSTWFYHPASIAGRPIFSGYTYFTWSYGYDQSVREQQLKLIYEAPTQRTLCKQLRRNGVSYVELNRNPESYLTPYLPLWNSLPASYTNPATGIRIYTTTALCQAL